MTETLADQLKRLCCAETEGKFFDCVTNNIDNIIAALRSCDEVRDAKGVDGFGKMLAWIVEGAPDRAQGIDAARRLRIYIWGLENKLSIISASPPEQLAAETCEYCDSSMEGFSDCPNCKLKGGKIEQPAAPKETGV